MTHNTLKLSLILALSLATLAACDKHGKKSEDAAAPETTNTAAAAPATTPTTTTATPPAATAAPASADASDAKHAWKEACADDLKKLCADADKPRKCLREHKDQLSEACKAGLAAARAAQKADKGE